MNASPLGPSRVKGVTLVCHVFVHFHARRLRKMKKVVI